MNLDLSCGFSLITRSSIEQAWHEGSINLFQDSLEDGKGSETKALVLIPILPLASCITLVNLLNLLSFSILACKWR